MGDVARKRHRDANITAEMLRKTAFMSGKALSVVNGTKAASLLLGILPIVLGLLPATAQTSIAAIEGWRLVRTPGPDRIDVVSVMRTAEIMQSDAEFAGIMIRCRPKSGLQIAFAVITPFHPRSRPKITLGVNRAEMPFQAEVIPPGSLIALPNEAEVLLQGSWQSAKALTVDIENEGSKIRGVVSLENLSGAVAQLQASCPQ